MTQKQWNLSLKESLGVSQGLTLNAKFVHQKQKVSDR